MGRCIKDGYEYVTNHSDVVEDLQPYNEGIRLQDEERGWFVVKHMVIGDKHYRLFKRRLAT